jgi:hypothetical protein
MADVVNKDQKYLMLLISRAYCIVHRVQDKIEPTIQSCAGRPGVGFIVDHLWWN